MDGKSLRLVLRWLLNREDLQDAEIATALGVTTSSYSRHKDDEDFPSFEELDKIGKHFDLSAKMLQIAFGVRSRNELVLLNDDEMRQYIEQGGANHPNHPTLAGARKEEKRKGVGMIPSMAMVRGGIASRVATESPPDTGKPWENRPSL